jgi:hypothetical protein
MGFGLNIKDGRTDLPTSRGKTNSAEKNISRMLRKNGITSTSGNASYAAQLALQEMGVSVVNKNKNYSLIEEQTKNQKIDNPNIPSTRKKRTRSSTSISFTSNKDPFYDTENAKPTSEAVEKANTDRQATYEKSIPVANYLATINNGK